MPAYSTSELLGNPNGGEDWNDGTYSSVREITVKENGNTVTALQLKYGLIGTHPTVKGRAFEGTPHGGIDGEETVFHLASDEYLTGISGYYGLFNGAKVIKCLNFQTNKGKKGPVGPETGTPFETTGNGKIVGFFGKADGDFLYAIGVYKYA